MEQGQQVAMVQTLHKAEGIDLALKVTEGFSSEQCTCFGIHGHVNEFLQL